MRHAYVSEINTSCIQFPFLRQVMAGSSSAADSESEQVSEIDEEKKETKRESSPKETEDKRRSRRRRRSRRDGSHERGRDERKDRDRRRRRKQGVPEPEHPPKAKRAEKHPEPGKEDWKGAGKKNRDRYWVCFDCGQRVAPYRAAMDQHRFLNENCLASQAWNRLSRSEQNEAGAWPRCKQEARAMKFGRRSELFDADAFEEIPEEEDHRGWSLHSAPASSAKPWQGEQSERLEGSKAIRLREKSPGRLSPLKAKKVKKDDRDSSPEAKKSKKGKKHDRESTSSSAKDRTSSKKRSKQVVININ